MTISCEEFNLITNNQELLGDHMIESEKSFIERKRVIDILYILDLIVKNELTKFEREIFIDKYFNLLSTKEIAEKHNFNNASIYKIHKRTVKKIQNHLKYVVMFQRDCLNSTITPLELKKLFALSAIRSSPRSSLAHRLKILMSKEAVSIDTLCACTDIDRSDFREILHGQRLPSVNELLSLSYFFKTSTDYLLKGDSHDK